MKIETHWPTSVKTTGPLPSPPCLQPWSSDGGPGSQLLEVAIHGCRRLLTIIADFWQPDTRRIIARALALPPRGGVPHDVLVPKSFRLSGHCLQLEWRARVGHPWDSDLPRARRAELFAAQTLKDTDAAIIRLFRSLPDVEEIQLQVVKPMAFGGVICTGVVDRETALALDPPPSLNQRLITFGVHFKLRGQRLAILPANSWGPMLRNGQGGLRPSCMT